MSYDFDDEIGKAYFMADDTKVYLDEVIRTNYTFESKKLKESLNKDSEGIEVEGHIGTWYVIDTIIDDEKGELFLLEHEEYGDEASCVIVDKYGKLVMEDVYKGFDDYYETK